MCPVNGLSLVAICRLRRENCRVVTSCHMRRVIKIILPWHPMFCRKCKGLITLCVVSLVFLFFLAFLIFLTFLILLTFLIYQHVGIQNASETHEKCKKNQNCDPKARKYFYITLWVVSKCLPFAFFSRFFSCFLVTNLTKTQSQRKNTSYYGLNMYVSRHLHITTDVFLMW